MEQSSRPADIEHGGYVAHHASCIYIKLKQLLEPERKTEYRSLKEHRYPHSLFIKHENDLLLLF
jgi:hypothetical protein